jgi:NAD(P) transhydrogenase subunit alpha
VEISLVLELTILVLAIFLGFEVISKVPTMLHTPLMSGTNAIHGIVIVGAILVAGSSDADGLTRVVGFLAVVLATANVVGGFVVTDRMLEMFKRHPSSRSSGDAGGARPEGTVQGSTAPEGIVPPASSGRRDPGSDRDPKLRRRARDARDE